MKNRIIVCAEVPFPRGVAGSNLTLSYCKLFKNLGYDVVTIGLDSKKKDEVDKSSGYYVYDEIKYLTVKSGRGKLAKLNNKVFSSGRTVELLDKVNAGEDDIIMVYASNGIYLKKICEYARRNRIKIFSVAVEWHQPFQYKGGKLNIRYVSNKRGMEKYNPKIGNVVCISALLEDYYKNRGCNTTVIPAIIDCDKTDDREIKENKNSEKIKIVYAGSPFGKDDIFVMLKAINSLCKEDRQKFIFYWIGMKKAKIVEKFGEDGYLLDELSDCIEIREWMQHDELVEFYKDADYLFFSRPDNKVSNAGFPSKLPEAMIQGIAVLTNRVGDCVTYLNDEVDSIIFAENTVESCAEGLHRAVNVSKEKLSLMKNNAFNTAKEKFDYSNWTIIMKEFIDSLK